jgi:predicted MFS family arabinose efflux permease
MSAKSGVKIVVAAGDQGRLYHWVALLTGSKNALKGLGFFMGGLLLATIGFQPSLFSMAAVLLLGVFLAAFSLPGELGQASRKPRIKHLFSKSPEVNQLSAARFFLFASRDVWFVVGLPLYLAQTLNWSPPQVSGWLAAWIIGYGIVQAGVPRFIRRGHHPDGATTLRWLVMLILSLCLLLGLLYSGLNPALAILIGLALFGVVFAVNSAVHSYLILAYAQQDGVSLDVGFYYMANAAGRLAGTLLSGLLYVQFGLLGCLLGAVVLLLGALTFSLRLPRHP